MNPKDLPNLIAWYRTTAAGYAGGKLIDFADRGLHWPLAAGAPVFATRGGMACMDLDGSQYFDRANVIPADATIVTVLRPNLSAADARFDYMWARARTYGANDHAVHAPTDTWAASGLALSSVDSEVRTTNYQGAQASTAATKNAWHVVTHAVNALGLRKVAVDLGAPVTAVEGNARLAILALEAMRLGFRATGITANGGTNYLAVAEIIILSGDMTLDDPTLLRALVADRITQLS